MLLHRCSLCHPMWQEGWCTKPVLHPVTQALSVLQVLWRVRLCTTSIWTSLGRRLPHSTKLCLPQVRKLATTIMTITVYKCLASVHTCLTLCYLSPDPNMVNAYMYQTAGTNGQAAPPPGQGPPNTSPSYSNYQPTPSQGYQVLLDTIIFWPIYWKNI